MAKTKEIKKHWVSVYSTHEFGKNEIGEVPYTEIKTLNGRVLKINLYLLTNDSRKQNAEIAFKIINSDGKTANTEVLGYKILNAYIKKVIRKGKEKVDDSFVCETKDKVKVKVKPFFITKNKTKASVVTSIRHEIRKIVSEVCKDNDFEKIIREIISNNLQRNLKQEIKRIYPLNLFEIREFVRDRVITKSVKFK